MPMAETYKNLQGIVICFIYPLKPFNQFHWYTVIWPNNQISLKSQLVHRIARQNFVTGQQFDDRNLQLHHGVPLADAVSRSGTKWNEVVRTSFTLVRLGKPLRNELVRVGPNFRITVNVVNLDGDSRPRWNGDAI